MRKPFIQLAVNDHFGDTALRICPAFARGVWMDMLCLMAGGEPYGHLRMNPAIGETTSSEHEAKHNRTPLSEIPTNVKSKTWKQRKKFHVEQSASRPENAPISGRIPANGSLETLLPMLTGTPKDVIEEALQHLEYQRVFSRIQDGPMKGVIFSRRMVRDEEKYQIKSTLAKQDSWINRIKEIHSSGKQTTRKSGGVVGEGKKDQNYPLRSGQSRPENSKSQGAYNYSNTKKPPLTPPSQGGDEIFSPVDQEALRLMAAMKRKPPKRAES